MGLLDSITGAIFGDAASISEHAGARNLANTAFSELGKGAEGSLPLAFQTLETLLGRGGKIDPRAKLRQQQAVKRGAAGQQQNVARSYARRGLGGSGVAQAIQAAIGFGGEGKAADIEAQNAQFEEQMARSDIGLAMQSLINPALQGFGIERGVDAQNAQIAQSQQNATLQALGAVAGGYASR